MVFMSQVHSKDGSRGTPLTDNGDSTWSVTVEMEPGTYEFKFINSNAWDGEENMEGTGCNVVATASPHSMRRTMHTRMLQHPCLPDPDQT